VTGHDPGDGAGTQGGIDASVPRQTMARPSCGNGRNSASDVRRRDSSRRRRALSALIVFAVLSGSLILSRQPVDFSRFAALGYYGVFLATLVGSATVVFPLPNVATVLAAGVLFDPVRVAIAAGLGSTLGEFSGYLLGYAGVRLGLDVSSRWYPAISSNLRRYGGVAIFVLALIPNPLFDLAGIAAGTSRYPIARFALATLLGKTLRSLVLSYLGSTMA